jgi:GTP pyrophosphokinase
MHLSPRFEDALVYATQIHAHQHRKRTGIPYISHLLAVAAIALEHGATEDEAIGALLHDAGEDAGGCGRIADIRVRFGDAVAEIVNGCTDTVENPKPEWTKRKLDYIAHLSAAPASVRLVSAADKLHNARSILSDFRRIHEEVWNRFNKGRGATLWYYRALADTFQQVGPQSLAEELDRVVTDIERESNGGQRILDPPTPAEPQTKSH